jgi:hypothetical protein
MAPVFIAVSVEGGCNDQTKIFVDMWRVVDADVFRVS